MKSDKDILKYIEERLHNDMVWDISKDCVHIYGETAINFNYIETFKNIKKIETYCNSNDRFIEVLVFSNNKKIKRFIYYDYTKIYYTLMTERSDISILRDVYPYLDYLYNNYKRSIKLKNILNESY
jgi:hypothetical protein